MTGRIGVWCLGAAGSVAATTAVGIEAIRLGLVGHSALVTEMEAFHPLGLVRLGDLVLGGHDVCRRTPLATARELYRRSGFPGPDLLAAAAPALQAFGDRVRPGFLLHATPTVEGLADRPDVPAGESLRSIVDRLRADLRSFRETNDLDRVVVVNLASTEPNAVLPPEAATPEGFLRLIAEDRQEGFTCGPLYALAAIEEDCPFINFTPASATDLPALAALAEAHGIPHTGKDGKTGETLVKTALAPLFAARNLRVLSWESHNILGNRDGEVLRDDAAREAKVRDKDDSLRQILGEPDLHTRVRIDHVPSLDDWKTAWNFIHFEGFLGVKMSMQFTWQGCDSILAAPLVLDLVRLADLAHRRGEAGALPHTACFFKRPIAGGPADFHRQFEGLLAYVRNTVAAPNRKATS